MTEIIGWHFANNTLRDGSPLPAKGVTLPRIEHIEPCRLGYHASERAIDALQYAPGSMVARVRLIGNTRAHGTPVDKHVGHVRETLSSYIDSGETLRAWGRWCVLQIIHLWDAPDVVKTFLETGQEDLRDAARAAAAQTAAQDAAWAAARDVAQDAAWAARTAAWTAARDMAQDAAWAARTAAWTAAQDAARAAAWAAWAAARNAAWDAARDAARDEQNKKLTEMLEKLTETRNDGA